MNEGLEGRSVRRLLLLAGGGRLMALANPSGVFVYDFVEVAPIPDLTPLARIMAGLLLATIGVLAARGLSKGA